MANNSATDSLLINVSLNAKEMTRSIQNAERQIEKFAHNINTIIGSALDILALKFSLTFGKNLVEAFSNTGAKLGNLSQQIGESTGRMDQWATAVRKAGGNADTFFNTINGLHNKLVDMKIGGDMKTAGIFGLLGINTQTATGELKKPTDILLELSDKLKGQSKDFQQHIGRQLGIDDATLRVLSQGREETLKLVNAQEQLWDDKKVAEAQKMQNKLIDLDRKLEQLKITIAEKLLPYADKFINWIMEFVSKHGKDLADTIEQVVAAIIDLVKYLPGLIDKISQFNKDMGITAGTLAKVLTGILALKVAKDIFGLISMGATAATAGVSAMMGPLGAIVATIGSIKWVFDKYEEFKNNPDSFKTEDRSLTNVKGKLGRLFQTGEKIGGWAYDLFHDDIDINKPKISKGDYDKYIEKLAPRISQIESSGGTNINSGNGAYGAYQVRPNWGNRARAKENLPAQSKEWFLDPKNSYETYKLMMRQNLNSTGGNLDAAIKMYSGNGYGLDKVMAQKINNINPALIGMNNLPNPNTASNQATSALSKSSVLGPQASNTNTININEVNVKSDNIDDMLDSVQSKVNPAFAFNNSPRLT